MACAAISHNVVIFLPVETSPISATSLLHQISSMFFLQGMHELTVRLGHYSTNIHYYVDDHEGES